MYLQPFLVIVEQILPISWYDRCRALEEQVFEKIGPYDSIYDNCEIMQPSTNKLVLLSMKDLDQGIYVQRWQLSVHGK